MVELRKRKSPPPSAPAPSKKKSTTSRKANDVVAEKAGDDAPAADVQAPTESAETAAPAATATKSSSGSATVGNSIDLDGFGGEVETNDGTKVTLHKLVEESKAGVVIFTYPKASTPGCTTQACMFRDNYTQLTSTGFSIYGLSSDSPKSNTTFKTKQNLPYPLLCDPAGSLIKAIGMHKAPKGTKRGVFVVDKAGKVLAAETGGPAATLQAVQKLFGADTAAAASVGNGAEESKVEKEIQDGKASAMDVDEGKKPEGQGELERVPTQEDKDKAAVADDVADSAAKLDAEGANGAAA